MVDEVFSKSEEPSTQSRSDFMSDLDDDLVSQPIEESPQLDESETVEKNQEQKLDIDERFKDLPEHEAILRTAQSRYDKLYSTHEKIVQELEQNSKIVEFVNQLEEDDTILEAYLRERKPDLVQKRDISTIVKEKLTEEFPEFAETKPTRQDADDDPGGRSWLYYRRLDELYTELKGKGADTQTLKELRESRKKQQAEQQAVLEKQLGEVKTRFKWSDQQIEEFVNNVKTFSIMDLARLYRLGLNSMKLPSVNQVSGSQPQSKTARSSFLESL